MDQKGEGRECKICNKTYANYNSLWNHTKKFHSEKVVVIPTTGGSSKKYYCIYCEKTFNDKSNKYKHQKICHVKKEEETVEIKEELNELKKEIEKLKKVNPNINNGNINNGTVNNIVINNYDKDNMDYITDKFKQKILNMIPNDQVNVIPKLLENIKFNSNHKENNNFKINSDRSNICFKFKDNQWISDNKNKSLNELLDYGNKIVKQFYEEGNEVLDDEKKEEYHNFQDKIFKKLKKQVDKQTKKDNILRNQIMKEIENIAYTYTKNNK